MLLGICGALLVLSDVGGATDSGCVVLKDVALTFGIGAMFEPRGVFEGVCGVAAALLCPWTARTTESRADDPR